MPKLPNPPKSKRLTKKVGLECLAILKEIDRVLFAHDILELPCLWEGMREATGTEDPDKWVQEMHDRIIDARANLWYWKNNYGQKAKKQKASRQRKQGRYVITRVAPDGMRLYLTEFTPTSDGHALRVDNTAWIAIKKVAVEFSSYDYARWIADGIAAGETGDPRFAKISIERKED